MEIRKNETKTATYDLLGLNTEEYLTLLWCISDLAEKMEEGRHDTLGNPPNEYRWYRGYEVDTIRTLNTLINYTYDN